MNENSIQLPAKADFSYIQDIAGGQNEAYYNLLKIVSKNLEEYPPQIAEAHQQQDWETMKALAHKYKSCTAYLNFPQLNEALTALEHSQTQQLSVEECEGLLAQITALSSFLYKEATKVLEAKEA